MSSSSAELGAMRLFHYYPVNGAPDAFAAIFFIFTLLFIHRIYITKSSKWLYILPATALVEAIGYAFRVVCVYNTTLGNYVGMDLLILIAPNALALVNYKTLGVIIGLSTPSSRHNYHHRYDPDSGTDDKTIMNDDENGQVMTTTTTTPLGPSTRFWLRPKFVTWFFFWSDFFAFVLQGGGGGMQATAKLRDIGDVITLVGLSIQLFFFACFAIIAIYVYRDPRYDYSLVSSPIDRPKKKVMVCLFATILLLYIRAIYRVAEYATGYDGIIATAEWAFYVFDTAIITLCFILYYLRFIGNYLPSPHSTLPLDQNMYHKNEK